MTRCKWSLTVREASLVTGYNFPTSVFSDGKQARVVAQETNLAMQQAANDIDEIKCSWIAHLSLFPSSCLNFLTGNQLIQLLRSWLSPSDPSTNHNIAQKAQHSGTTAWLFAGQIIIKWKSTSSLLWIHGKRVFLFLYLACDFSRALLLSAGSGKSVIWFVFP